MVYSFLPVTVWQRQVGGDVKAQSTLASSVSAPFGNPTSEPGHAGLLRLARQGAVILILDARVLLFSWLSATTPFASALVRM